MPTGTEQASHVRDLASQGRYEEAYRYISDQIDGDPNWDPRLAEWFNRAADINGPTPNFWKLWIFTSNALAGNRDPASATTEQWNQDASDSLARDVLAD